MSNAIFTHLAKSIVSAETYSCVKVEKAWYSFTRTFVHTRFLTGPEVRAHIKWPPRTFVHQSNYHPGRSCTSCLTTPDVRSPNTLLPRTFVHNSTLIYLIYWPYIQLKTWHLTAFTDVLKLRSMAAIYQIATGIFCKIFKRIRGWTSIVL